MLRDELRHAIEQLQKSYPEKRSALIPALHLVQKEKGFLSPEAQQDVAELFGIDVNEVYSVVSFYDMFFTSPPGRHIIHVCTNISCMLRGSDGILSKVCQKLKVRPGETTEDGLFTVLESECLAACDKAPMLLGDETVFGPLHPDDIDHVIRDITSHAGHPCPVELPEDRHE